jgi:malic enzyme
MLCRTGLHLVEGQGTLRGWSAVTVNGTTFHPGRADNFYIFPAIGYVIETEVTTATRVAEFMFDEGLAQVERPRDIRALTATAKTPSCHRQGSRTY